MPSPFPGMDPYLEDRAVWPGFHSRFINACYELLLARLPSAYDADIEERVQLVEVALEEPDRYQPDVSISQGEQTPTVPGTTTTAALAPVTIPALPPELIIEPYIEIFRADGRELVTAVELLSHSNKYGRERGAYRRKRDRLVRQAVHVVEIDLLVRGHRTPLTRPLPMGDYYAMVFRGDCRPDVDVYAWRVRDRLPMLPVPLKQPDADVLMDMAAIVNTAYERGRYDRKLRYAAPTPAPLGSEDLAWAADVAKATLPR